jgi:hypothetical protein
MSPKEKAKELLDKMTKQTYEYQEYAGANYTTYEIGYQGGKKCALIAVDEILNHHSTEQGLYRIDRYYWQEVKKQIDKL